MTCPKINTDVPTTPIQYQPGTLSCTNIAFLTACPTKLRWTARPKPVKELSFRRTGTIATVIQLQGVPLTIKGPHDQAPIATNWPWGIQ